MICSLAASAATSAFAIEPVRIGSKAFTESVILGELATQLGNNAGVVTIHRSQLGGTRVLYEALLAGQIDVYPEYTGTIVQELLPGTPSDMASIKAALARHGIGMTRPLGFNDIYALGVPEILAHEDRIRTISDLTKHPELRFGFSNEFLDRKDGWPLVRATYALAQTNVTGLDHDLAYRAISSGSINVIDLYSTDAEIAFYHLKVLDDDRHVFPLYEAVFLYRIDLHNRAPAILSTFTSMADPLLRGILRDLFTQGTNIDPTAIEQGKIIVISMPLKIYGQIGLYAASLWKFAFQKSIERRDPANQRPVALWMDEGHFFLHRAMDFLFTSTSRSSRVCNVLLTQSVSSVIATLGGGPAGKAEADAYLSNYGTKIFHANTDPVSNEYAAGLIGRCKQFMINSNINYACQGRFGGSERVGSSSGISEIFEYEVQPAKFSQLRTGGVANKGKVDSIIFRNGAPFKATKRNWMEVTFMQDLRP